MNPFGVRASYLDIERWPPWHFGYDRDAPYVGGPSCCQYGHPMTPVWEK